MELFKMNIKNNNGVISGLALLAMFGVTSVHAVQQVEYADMKRSGANPVIVVTGTGSSYTDASSSKLTFHAEAKGRCTWANRFYRVEERLSKPNHQPQHAGDFLAINEILDIHDGYKNKDRTWSSSMKPISIKWAPNKAVRDAAIKSCNDKRANLINSGNAPQGSFQGTALVDQVEHQFSFACSTLVSLTPNQIKDFSVAHPIGVQCEKLTPIQAELKLPAVPMQIKHVAVVADPKNYSGMCPANMKFKGTINTEGPGGEIQYRFLTNGKPITGFIAKTIPEGQKSTSVWVTKSLEPENTPQGQQPAKPKGLLAKNQGGMQAQVPMGMMPTEKVTMEVKRDNQIRTAEGSYTIKCQQATLIPGLVPMNTDGKPDLTSRQGIRIGNKSSSWGGNLILSKTDFINATARGCSARFLYDVVNIGKTKAMGFNSRLRINGKQIHLKNNMAINKNQSKNVSGTVLLPVGTYQITASIDDGKSVEETKETNNVFKVTVTVPSNCGGGVTPRPNSNGNNPVPRSTRPIPSR